MKKILYISLAIFVLLVFFKSQCSGQGHDTISSKKQFVIKGFIYGVPPYFNQYGYSLSLGFEKRVSEKGYLVLNGYYAEKHDGMGDFTENIYSLMPGFRLHFREGKSTGLEFWTEFYFNYIYKKINDGYEDGFKQSNTYGLGVAEGTKLFLSKKRNWFLDLGMGLSYNIKLLEYKIYNGVKQENGLKLRPIIQIGISL